MMYSYADSLLDPKNCASKRVSRACDRCRLKKTKCDGRRCCNRCLADDAICIFSKRKRSSDRPYSSEYVQLLEDQQMKLVEGVQELYRRLRRGEGWAGPQIAEDSQGYPLVQDVLDSLAVLAPSERRSPKRKASEASVGVQDDDEEQSPASDVPARLSISPPLTPPASQPSGSSSPVNDTFQNQLNIASVPLPFQHLTADVISTDPEVYTSSQSLQNQPLLSDGSEFWSMTPSFSATGSDPDFTGLIDPFTNPQTNCTWFPNSYMML